MAMVIFNKIPVAEKTDIYRQISNKTGIPVFAVEKDWWVVQALSVVFDMEAGHHLIFKGGTSLSKAWKLIERFSEDIDLAIDREFFGCRSLREPFTHQLLASLVDETYPQSDFAQPSVIIPTANPERTFLEKIFLLHEEFQRPLENRRVERLSRHLYDVFQLSKTEFAEKALYDSGLYSTIVEHRYNFTRVGWVNYNLHQPQTINFIPPAEVMDDWKADYNTMKEQMIYGNKPPSFDQIISELSQLKIKINALTWKFAMKFPIPKI